MEGGEKLLVNYRYLEIYKRETGKIMYNNRWNTDKVVSKEHVKLLAEYARTRWKLEHENNNILKNYGYHLEHHFGDGENRAGEVYYVLNLLAFLVHGIMIGWDENFIKARVYFVRGDKCYKALRTFFWAFEFPSWGDFLLFVIAHARGG
jgi:hypothetical protein